MISSVPIPDVSRITFHPIMPSSNENKALANKNERFPLAAIPIRFQLDDVATQFVQVSGSGPQLISFQVLKEK